jgi:2-succinyl-6-hydroxy-2,4-cyclohexadiene-1-carboxylate synthase
MAEDIVLLHGFGGTHRAWDGVLERLDRQRYRPHALDLPGHGVEADAEHPITFQGCLASVLERAPERFILCGYSLGGRLALQIALEAPQRVSRLLLISSSPGIEDPLERAARREADHHLAEDLEEVPFDDFIERWRTQPLFAAEPPEVGRLAREDHARNLPEALAAVMRGVGTGEMEPLWSRLGELQMPVTVLAGERDLKFLEIGRRMAKGLSRGELCVVEGGHGLVLENPAAIAAGID